MSSKSIYTRHPNLTFAPAAKKFEFHDPKIDGHTAGDRTPYTYYIAWVNELGSITHQYYGVRYAKGCHPSEFWIDYKTSSEYVKYMDIPDILEIRKVFINSQEPIVHEYRVLTRLDVVNNTSWINMHNGINFSKEKVKSTMLTKYGTEFPLQNDEILEKTKQTHAEKFGGWSLSNEEVRQKSIQTWTDKYGVDNPLKADEIKQKIINTNIEKYGVEWIVESEEFKIKSRETCLEKYGTEYATQSEIVKEKTRQTDLEKYGVEYHIKSPEIIEKSKATKMERYGSKKDGYKQITDKTNKTKESRKLECGDLYCEIRRLKSLGAVAPRQWGVTFDRSKLEKIIFEMKNQLKI